MPQKGTSFRGLNLSKYSFGLVYKQINKDLA